MEVETKTETDAFLTAQIDPSPQTLSLQTAQPQILQESDRITSIEVKPLPPGADERKSTVAANLTLRFVEFLIFYLLKNAIYMYVAGKI
jgi:hypothetical protein